MEVISIDGIEYIRAAVLAKRFKYTSDYIGQLCRGGKVDAKLVGRTWYVNPESLTGHKTNRYAKSGVSDKAADDSYKITISRQNVEPVLRKETVKSLSPAKSQSSNYLRRIEWKPLKYETDAADLLPPVGTLTQPVTVAVDLAEARSVPVRAGKSETTLVTEPLPEVALSGSLRVSSLDDNFEKDLENIDISDEFSEFIEPSEDIQSKLETPEPAVSVSTAKKSQPMSKKESIRDPLNPSYPVAIKHSFAPARVSTSIPPSDSSQGGSLWPYGLLLVAFLAATALLLLTEVSVLVVGSELTTSFTLSDAIFSSRK